MGMVAPTYKVMPDSDVEDVSAEDIVTQIQALKDDVYDVQLCETKPLAFGLKFIQVHVVMNDGSGSSDVFEENMRAIRGTGEIEVLSMGLLDNHKGCLIYPLFEDSNKPLELLERRTHELT